MRTFIAVSVKDRFPDKDGAYFVLFYDKELNKEYATTYTYMDGVGFPKMNGKDEITHWLEEQKLLL